MQLKLIRKWFTQHSTIGELYAGDVFLCYTLEDTVRPEGVKVYGQTAIPAGTYKLIIDLSTRFKRFMPHILNVPGFSGIRMHKGNTDVDTLGCVLVGVHKETDRIWDCEPAYERLMNTIGVDTGFSEKYNTHVWLLKDVTTAIEIINQPESGTRE